MGTAKNFRSWNVRSRLAFLCLASVSIAAFARADDTSFPALAESFREEHCPKTPKGEKPVPCSLDEVLERSYARLELGAFEVFYPAEQLKKKKGTDQLAEVASTLLKLQSSWIAWLSEGDDRGEPIDTATGPLLEWVSKWNRSKLSRSAKDDEKDLVVLLEPDSATQALLTELQDVMYSKELLGIAPYKGKKVRILCCPTRREFMQLVGYTGVLDPNLKAAHWVSGVEEWTQIWSEWTMILALEYAPWDLRIGKDDFDRGRSMDQDAKQGMSEHVCQQAAAALVRNCLARQKQRRFESALAMNLTIDVFGAVHTVEGEGGLYTQGASTQPYSRFVPGGNSAGGTLPAIPAAPLNVVIKNPWRKDEGEDHFAAALRKGQKAGAKRAAKELKRGKVEDPTRYFQLEIDNGAGKHAVRAPFFGPHSEEQPYPPTAFLTDYREFFRAYRSGFFHWMRTSFDPESEEASRAKFTEFLRGLGSVARHKNLEGWVEKVYGLPLSGPDGSVDSLEWRYLRWLAD